jgi:hypothetical protein
MVNSTKQSVLYEIKFKNFIVCFNLIQLVIH